MTEARKEWAEGLREEIATTIADSDEWCCDECRAAAIPDTYLPVADAVLAVLEPRVISLAGEVERLGQQAKSDADLIGNLRRALYEAAVSDDPAEDLTLDHQGGVAFLHDDDRAAALSPHPSEPEA